MSNLNATNESIINPALSPEQIEELVKQMPRGERKKFGVWKSRHGVEIAYQKLRMSKAPEEILPAHACDNAHARFCENGIEESHVPRELYDKVCRERDDLKRLYVLMVMKCSQINISVDLLASKENLVKLFDLLMPSKHGLTRPAMD
jgi:hypothetical protein